MFLLDTVVVSELRKQRRNPYLIEWIGQIAPTDLFLSAVTIGEIEIGIEKQRAVNPAFATDLAHWLDATLRAYADRILPLDMMIARRWGRLAARLNNKGLDLAIAATALEHGLTVATRNVADFVPTGAQTLDPFIAPRRRRS